MKSFIPREDKKDVVYQIPCKDCNCLYIGGTGKSPRKRVTEYNYTVNWKNGVADHAWDKGHNVDWDGVKVLECEPSY